MSNADMFLVGIFFGFLALPFLWLRRKRIKKGKFTFTPIKWQGWQLADTIWDYPLGFCVTLCVIFVLVAVLLWLEEIPCFDFLFGK